MSIYIICLFRSLSIGGAPFINIVVIILTETYLCLNSLLTFPDFLCRYMLQRNHYKTIVISDVHLGTRSSKVKELVRFLKKNTADKLILNGDIIDFWQLKKYGKWKKKHTRFFKTIINLMQNSETEVIYLRGNHDDIIDAILPLKIANFSIEKEYYHESNGKRFWVTHGDIYDGICTEFKWLAKLGDLGYVFLIWLNRHYNYRRVKKRKPYFSLSQYIKSKVKSAVSYIFDFQNTMVQIARINKCDGVICGHIHHAVMANIDGITYLNSGDWVESLTALTEDFEGNWEIIYYQKLEEIEEGDVPEYKLTCEK